MVIANESVFLLITLQALFFPEPIPSFLQKALFQLMEIGMDSVKNRGCQRQRKIPVSFGDGQEAQNFRAEKIRRRDRECRPDPSAQKVDQGKPLGRIFGESDRYRNDRPQTVQITLYENDRPAVLFEQQMGDRKFTPLPVQLALNKGFIEAADIKINLVSGKTAEPCDKNRQQAIHVAGMGQHAGHDQAAFTFQYRPCEQDDVAVFLKPL